MARRQYDGGIVSIRKGIDNFPCGVCDNETVSGIAQSVAYAAIGYKDDIPTEVGEVGVKVSSGSDHSKATRRQSQGGERIGLMVIADSPTSQIDCLPCAV